MRFNTAELSDAIELIIDHRGLTPKKFGGDWSNHGYKALSAKNIKTGRIVQKETIRYVDPKMYKKWMTTEVEKNDIFITSEAPFGEVYLWNSDEKIVLSQRLFGLRIKKSFDPYYLYYYMCSREFQAELNGRSSGTTVTGLRQPELLKCKIKFPIIAEQIKIGSILKSLDDKIETNNKINDNLSKQITEYFVHLFIDNEDATTWEQSNISSLIKTTLGGDWGKDSPTGNNIEMVYCIRGADIPDIKFGNKGKMPIRYILSKNYAAKKLHDGDLVVEISGGSPTQSTGRVAYISNFLLSQFDKGLVCTNFCRAITPKAEWSLFLYTLWQYLYDKDLFFIYENGTTGIKNFDLSSFINKEQIAIPPIELLRKFNAFSSSALDMIFKNGLENERLSNLRDLLLPKLMSGEIDVESLDL